MKVGDYAVLSGTSYSAVRNVVYEVVGINHVSVDVKDAISRTRASGVKPRDLTIITPNDIRLALIRTTARLEAELQTLRSIAKEADKIIENTSNVTTKNMAMTIKDMLAYEEDLSEQDIMNVINGNTEKQNTIEILARLCRGHLDFGYEG